MYSELYANAKFIYIWNKSYFLRHIYSFEYTVQGYSFSYLECVWMIGAARFSFGNSQFIFTLKHTVEHKHTHTHIRNHTRTPYSLYVWHLFYSQFSSTGQSMEIFNLNSNRYLNFWINPCISSSLSSFYPSWCFWRAENFSKRFI